MQQETNANVPALYTVPNLADKHRQWLTEPALRNHILNAADRKNSRGEVIKGNGLEESGAIVRIGRRILIDEAKFFSWLAQQQRRKAA